MKKFQFRLEALEKHRKLQEQERQVWLSKCIARMRATEEKLFDLDNVACDKIGSFLINEVVECKTEAGTGEDCLAAITAKSLTSVQLSK